MKPKVLIVLAIAVSLLALTTTAMRIPLCGPCAPPNNARDGGRTRTPLAGLRILSPVRLPVPPPGLNENQRLKPTPPMTEKVILRILHFFATFRFEASGFGLPEPDHAELHLSNGDKCSE